MTSPSFSSLLQHILVLKYILSVKKATEMNIILDSLECGEEFFLSLKHSIYFLWKLRNNGEKLGKHGRLM
jgi:hypothetical protein